MYCPYLIICCMLAKSYWSSSLYVMLSCDMQGTQDRNCWLLLCTIVLNLLTDFSLNVYFDMQHTLNRNYWSGSYCVYYCHKKCIVLWTEITGLALTVCIIVINVKITGLTVVYSWWIT